MKPTNTVKANNEIRSGIPFCVPPLEKSPAIAGRTTMPSLPPFGALWEGINRFGRSVFMVFLKYVALPIIPDPSSRFHKKYWTHHGDFPNDVSNLFILICLRKFSRLLKKRENLPKMSQKFASSRRL
jgi:hypothetical protein